MKSFLLGALAGAVGTWFMDLVTAGLLEGQSKESLRREKEASPNRKSSVANLVDRIEELTGVALEPDQRSMATQAIHFGLGILTHWRGLVGHIALGVATDTTIDVLGGSGESRAQAT